MWNSMDVKPESGKRIIALFDDGSGGNAFLVYDRGFIDAHGNDRTSLGGYSRWAYLPDDFKLFFED